MHLIFFLFFSIIYAKQHKIAFGSCYTYLHNTTKAFDSLVKYDPDVFIWLGDAAYVTNKTKKVVLSTLNRTVIDQMFNNTKYHPDYHQLTKSTIIDGVWDDHDYNQNDGNRHNPTKEMIREAYLDFLDVAYDSPRRTNPNGIYHSFYVGDNIHIILLDVRWNKDPQNKTGTRQILGDEQWDWLEAELKNSNGTYQIIGSGSQIIPDDRLFIEVWYPQERKRLLNIIKQYGKQTILISGDVHYGEIMKENCFELEENRTLFELTSSGLSHSWLYLGGVKYLFETFVYIFLPDTYSELTDRYFGNNFGSIEIDEQNNIVKLNIHNEWGQIIIQKTLGEQSDKDRLIEKCELQKSFILLHYFFNFDQKFLKIFELKIIPWVILLGFIGLLSGYYLLKISRRRNKQKNN